MNPKLTGKKELDFWKKIILALDESVPFYNFVNSIISFGQIQRWREKGLRSFSIDGMNILDAGIGLGGMSITAKKFSNPKLIVGLDASCIMLKKVCENIKKTNNINILPVNGVFEALPFREGIFNGVICGFSFRDAINMDVSLADLKRVICSNGELLIVEVGKPDNLVVRSVYALFWKLIVPTLARFALGTKLKSNPWTWLYHTYDNLPSNSKLLDKISKQFKSIKKNEHYFGCLIVIYAKS
ncbi:MAG: class I SAM-dependent methyltransferase [Candidatus Bathyarchaeota archaeon]